MMNNPLSFVQMIRNPQKFIQQLAGNTNGMSSMQKNALQMLQKGDFAGCKKLAENYCKENGMNAEEMVGNLRQNISKFM